MESPVNFPPSSPPRRASSSNSEKDSPRIGYRTPPVVKTRASTSSNSALLPGFVPSSPDSVDNDHGAGVDSRKLAASLKHLASPTPDRRRGRDALLSSPPPVLPDAKMFLARMGGHMKLYNDNAIYPSPAPTSSVGFRSSSPPPASTLSEREEEEEELKQQQTLLEQRHEEKKMKMKMAPINSVVTPIPKATSSSPIIVSIPRKGGKVTIGRSSKSCNFALSSKNKLVSRVHVAITYIPQGNRVLFACIGWNGCRITVPTRLDENNHEIISEVDLAHHLPPYNGQTDYILPKGQHLEVKYVEGIKINVRGERALVKLGNTEKKQVVAREPLKAISQINHQVTHDDDDVEMVAAPLVTPATDKSRLVDKENKSQIESKKIFSVNETEKLPWVEKVNEKKQSLDTVSDKTPNSDMKREKKVLAERESEREKKSALGLPMRPIVKQQPNLENATEVAVLGEREELPKPARTTTITHSLPKRPESPSSNNFPFTKLHSTPTTPVITFKRPLPPSTESVEQQQQSPLSPSVGPEISAASTTHNSIEESSEPAKKKAKVIPLIDLERELLTVDLPNLANIICNHLAFSRLSSTPLSTLRSSSPVIGALSKPLLRLILKDGKRIPCVGVIYRQGKDAAGKPLEEEYYYMAENDSDSERRSMVEQLRGRGGGLRACRKTHKQYFWKKPSK
ncbi:hypothetical protein D0Z00_003801 [Geotrichum galactomycetum]|uniref:Uncharacterized protein n=1 Tax=Geotrichum galactomycetum TaxID=27317 RepID=A0ACB6V0C5_9ASCO|nr:hypothetical protein D0Z00_003801 [Geotrichum candidum]